MLFCSLFPLEVRVPKQPFHISVWSCIASANLPFLQVLTASFQAIFLFLPVLTDVLFLRTVPCSLWKSLKSCSSLPFEAASLHAISFLQALTDGLSLCTFPFSGLNSCLPSRLNSCLPFHLEPQHFRQSPLSTSSDRPPSLCTSPEARACIIDERQLGNASYSPTFIDSDRQHGFIAPLSEDFFAIGYVNQSAVNDEEVALAQGAQVSRSFPRWVTASTPLLNRPSNLSVRVKE